MASCETCSKYRVNLCPHAEFLELLDRVLRNSTMNRGVLTLEGFERGFHCNDWNGGSGIKSEAEAKEKLKGVLDGDEFPVFKLPAVLAFVWFLGLDKDEGVALVIASLDKGEVSLQSGLDELTRQLKAIL